MTKRWLWLGGVTVVVGLLVGFALAKRSAASHQRTCPLQAEAAASAEDPVSSTDRLVLPSVPKLALDLDKGKGELPSGSQHPAPSAAPPPARAENTDVQANAPIRTLTHEQMAVVRDLAKRVRQFRQAAAHPVGE